MEENGVKRLKARRFPHGNRDKEKENMRKYSATTQFDVIRLLCSLDTVLVFKFGCLDVQGAYLQSGPIRRDIFVRPPHEYSRARGVLWRLLKVPYGISEAGRQWAQVFEEWPTKEARFERMQGVPQPFARRGKENAIQMLLAKVTDDLLMTGSFRDIAIFTVHIRERFPDKPGNY